MALLTVLCSAVLLWAVVVPALGADKHSLYYIYTALSKPVELPGIYDFTAMGLLDDRQIDYYNSKEKKKIPTQHWMKEKMQEDYWDKGTQSRKSKEQWFNVNVKILMERMGHNNDSDVHVLQWRHGCEINQEGTEVKFSKGIDEYSYDGDNFLSFDDKESQWVAPVVAAQPTKRKWDKVPILNQYTKGYLEKECVDWLNKFREYGDEAVKKGSPPVVYAFARRSTRDKTKLKLTCLATGFYPKDVTLTMNRYRTALHEDEIESTGIRPNHDGTFQLSKSVEIKADDKAEYDCSVSHRTLREPIVRKWDGDCPNCNDGSFPGIEIGIGAAVVAALISALCFYLHKTKRFCFRNARQESKSKNDHPRDEKTVVLLPVVGDKAGSERSSNDSGKGSDLSIDIPTNSQEHVDKMDSSGKNMAENHELLP
ncbi:zinc-alpha-2-glycoprotein-like isoform X4 [Pimephales promelas]|uniref:zinc-alpha-2-glycoprotein-like isoform X4 n=1 Tax=Pimephales promelas TaxID=90988 RepID=UPI001955A1F0|nr:zinc-alpha-2-glycoprotein-like isoform X4 [Pimephales promelas]